jgi:hypothetical protein
MLRKQLLGRTKTYLDETKYLSQNGVKDVQ